jgi:hypothetical protein
VLLRTHASAIGLLGFQLRAFYRLSTCRPGQPPGIGAAL